MLFCFMFLMKIANLCLHPDVNAVYAACRCVFAINDNSVISSQYLATKDEI